MVGLHAPCPRLALGVIFHLLEQDRQTVFP
jgi:hypothetical protein